MNSLRLLLLVVPVFCLSVTLETQAQTRDTSAARQTQDPSVTTQGKFHDENGNGIDDRRERRGPGSRKDRFVDADGDGICDGRAGGLGFRRGAGNAGGASSPAGKGTGAGNRHGQGGKK